MSYARQLLDTHPGTLNATLVCWLLPSMRSATAPRLASLTRTMT